MRTTLTIDDDIAVRLMEQKASSDQSMKSIVNSLLRAGLEQTEKVHEPAAKYHIKPAKLGNKLPDLDNIAEILSLDDKPI